MSTIDARWKSLVMVPQVILGFVGASLAVAAIVQLVIAIRRKNLRRAASFSAYGVLLACTSGVLAYGVIGARDEVARVRVNFGMFRALTLYAQDHEWRMPEDLDALVETGYIDACGSNEWRTGRLIDGPSVTMTDLESLNIVWGIHVDEITEEGYVPSVSCDLVRPTDDASPYWESPCRILSVDLGKHFHRMRQGGPCTTTAPADQEEHQPLNKPL